MKKYLCNIFVYTILMGGLIISGMPGCGKQTPVSDENVPCGALPGLYLEITGTAEPITLCILDDELEGQTDHGVQAIYSEQNDAYFINGTYTDGNLVINISIRFTRRMPVPFELSATANEQIAIANTNYAWIHYEEVILGSSAFSSSVVSGSFIITFSDPKIAVATFDGLELTLIDDSQPPVTTQRTIKKGFINITSDPQ